MYDDDYISGQVDFLCGSGTAVFDRDTIDILGHPGGTVSAPDTGAAINSGQWQNWSSPPFPWQDARFHEFRNTGPGSVAAADVPQLTASQAASYTVAAYLGHWRPRLAGPAVLRSPEARH